VTIEIANESGEQVDEATLVALARHVLDRLSVHPAAELSVLLVDEATMSSLHERWMGEPGPTDVLAFPMDELDAPPGPDGAEVGPALLGDVVLCPQVAARQAAGAGHPTEAELHLLCTHGILHLLGYDHADPEEEREMFELQGEILRGWQEVHPAGGAPAPAGAGPPDTGGTAAPTAAGTELPTAAGTELPDAGGTELPDAGGTELPDAGGTELPDAGGTELPDAGGGGAVA
jgi:probable rRNA maturation factor